MVSRSRILQTFLTDALRLSLQALECLAQIEEQASRKRVSPGQVRSLYQMVHSLKGSAVMVEEAAPVVKALHSIEGLLSCRNVADSAKASDEWLPQAKEALASVHRSLVDLQRKTRNPAKIEPLVRGFLVRTTLPGRNRLLWFPLGCVSRILSPGEIADTAVLTIEGALVPVVGRGTTDRGRGCFGIAVRSQSGSAVIAVEEVAGVFAWSDAQKQGAEGGLDLFERGLFSKPKRKPGKAA
jgi:hypothetical protein